jgi:acyl carrier protein
VTVDSTPDQRQHDFEDVYPLTPMQAGILFHTLRSERSGPYVEQFVFTARVAPDPRRLAAAWTAAVDRHTALRTAFVWEGVDEPVQVVMRRARVPVDELDLTALSPDDADRAQREFLAEDRVRGFRLTAAPLMRLTLLRRADRCVVVWTLHHLVMDGWSMPITLMEVAAHYRGDGAATERPARPFRDFVAWLAEQPTEPAEAFWRHALRTARAETLSLACAGAPSEQRGRADAGRAYHDLPDALSDGLVVLAREARVTLSTVFQGAWGLLLARHTDRAEALFGAAVSGRPADLPGVEDIVGVFINTIVRRVCVDDEAELVPWLRRIQGEHLDTLPHQHLGLNQLQRLAGPPEAPLIDTILVFENYPSENPVFDLGDGIHLEVDEIVEDADYPLTLTVLPRQPSIRLQLLYHTDRFSGPVAMTLLGRLQTVLEQMTRRPRARVGDIHISAGLAATALTPAAAAALPAAASASDELWAHVVDRASRPMPVGVPGAIVLTARGSPAPDEPGTATGVRGYRTADGPIELLARPSAAQADAGAAVSAIATADRPALAALCALWTEVLGKTEIEPDSDFFRLGGDSLAAVRVVGRARMMFSVSIPVNALFEDRTPAQLVLRLDAQLGGPEATDRVALEHAVPQS